MHYSYKLSTTNINYTDLKLKKKKCHFFRKWLHYVGHLLSVGRTSIFAQQDAEYWHTFCS